MNPPSRLQQPLHARPAEVGTRLVVPTQVLPFPAIVVVVIRASGHTDGGEDEELPVVLKDTRVPLTALGCSRSDDHLLDLWAPVLLAGDELGHANLSAGRNGLP